MNDYLSSRFGIFSIDATRSSSNEIKNNFRERKQKFTLLINAMNKSNRTDFLFILLPGESIYKEYDAQIWIV